VSIDWVAVPYTSSLDGDHATLVNRRQLILRALGILAIGASAAQLLAEVPARAILTHLDTPIATTRILPASDDSIAGSILEPTLHVMMG
jgi:hypothetical protein